MTVNWKKGYYVGQEYVEDKDRISMRFDVQFYSPAELQSFDFYYKKKRISGSQEGRYLTVSFIEKLPRKLLDDIAENRKNAQQYVYGYLALPISRVNQEMLRQRYSLGHFLVSTFSFFDVASITLTNIDENPTDEVISMPWPPIFSAPPHSEMCNPETFIRDYIDSWNDYFKGDFDNCIRKLITSVENFFDFKKLNVKKKHPWWHLYARLTAHKPSFKDILNNLRKKSRFIGHEVVSMNLLFLYRVRNSITHGSLRIHQENGWWFCGKALETVQYFYQFLDGGDEHSNGAYAFRISAFASLLSYQTRGVTVEKSELLGKKISDEKLKDRTIQTDEDMNNFKFNNLRFTEDEKIIISKNRPRK
jgi:hypothetical protein